MTALYCAKHSMLVGRILSRVDLKVASAWAFMTLPANGWQIKGVSRVSGGVCRKTAVETAEGLYKQARKRRRAGDQIIPLLEKVQADLAYLE